MYVYVHMSTIDIKKDFLYIDDVHTFVYTVDRVD